MDRQFNEQEIPVSQQGIFQRAYSGKSRASAVKAKCLDCCGFDRKEAQNCTVVSCPLHLYNPFLPRERQKTQPTEKKTQKG